jgi:hypothetical protein
VETKKEKPQCEINEANFAKVMHVLKFSVFLVPELSSLFLLPLPPAPHAM